MFRCDHWGTNKLQYSWKYLSEFEEEASSRTTLYMYMERQRAEWIAWHWTFYTASTVVSFVSSTLLAPCWSDDIQGVNCESGGLIKRFIPLSRLTFAYFDMEMRMKCPMHYVNTHKFHFPSSSSTSSYAFFLNGWMNTSTTILDAHTFKHSQPLRFHSLITSNILQICYEILYRYSNTR